MRRFLICLVLIIWSWPCYPAIAEEGICDTVIFCCSEQMELQIPFNADLGRTFVIRNMGNVIGVAGPVPDRIEVGSVEYAVEYGAKRVIVLGHKGCRIIKSVIDCPKGRGNQPALFAVISKSVTAAKRDSSDSDIVWQKAVEYNVMNTVAELRNSRFILNDLVESSKLEIIGAIWNPETFTVEPLR